ncbi:MAG: Teichoic acids export ATP-binding protein TagH [candidate division BRC1 bacterium ADurb.BinA364]|nr:MAG: Teichoic acids export ATP-binding protein TagH [candidate division BRC1 bacterium ADurb.BinA364]
MTNAIEIRDLRKRYVVEEDRACTAKEALLRLFRPTTTVTIEALKPLTLDVPRGAALGIIGPNGAGKSTLLKLVAGVVAPTSGSVRVDGSLMALIELGAGFEGDLSGIDNIYLNGSILGLSDRQLDSLLPRIVEFAGLEEFILAPVKRYSSGMAMRLAFSIAAHVEPDIIVLDENLSVGDVFFQAKCIEKLLDLKKRGKTILLVTHSLDMAELLCDRVVWLRQGEAVRVGAPSETIARYELDAGSMPLEPWNDKVHRRASQRRLSGRFGDGRAVITRFALLDAAMAPTHVFGEGDPITLEVEFEAPRAIGDMNIACTISREEGYPVLVLNGVDEGYRFASPTHGRERVRIRLAPAYLTPGRYLIDVALCLADEGADFLDKRMQLYHFRVEKRYEAQLTCVASAPYSIEARHLGD